MVTIEKENADNPGTSSSSVTHLNEAANGGESVEATNQVVQIEESPNSRSTTNYPYPLDIIVQEIQNVVESRENDDSEDERDTAKEVNYALKRQGFKVVEKEYGADCEFLTYEPDVEPQTQNGTPAAGVEGKDTVGHHVATKGAGRFKKGHRRAFSMPNAHHRDKAVLIVAENNFRQEGPNRRHLVKYRLHPYRPNDKTEEAVTNFIEKSKYDPEEDEMDVTYDEEEITNIGEGQAGQPRFRLVRRIWESRWKVQNFDLLPEWLQDNEFLRTGHRPPLPSFTSCFNSIFQLHTETGNIWTHLYGCVAFIGVAIFFLSQPSHIIYWKDKLVFGFFFVGAIACLGLSFSFHTVQCHSPNVGKLFSKLDYSGITTLIVGSFVPFIYYGFYCRTLPMIIYVTMITVLGIAALIVSLWDKFAQPKYRALRATVFVTMGLSSIAPTLHLLITDGLEHMVRYDNVHWTVIMGLFYLSGAAIYATRFPERCFPGRCDLFCHSHQLFHIFVIIAAMVHFHGITEMAMKRLEQGSCAEQLIARYGDDKYDNFLDEKFRAFMF